MFRVSNQMIYSQSLNGINSKLSTLTELNLQSSTQKRVNRPSDDPTATVNILDHKDSLRSFEQYLQNVDTAKGWLQQSDSTLLQVSTILSRVKELAEETATGTVSATNRQQASYEVRQLFEQLVGMANTKYQGQSIYAGQKTDTNAFSEVLWMTTNDPTLSDPATNTFTIEGASKSTVLVQFTDAAGVNGPTSVKQALSTCNVRYSIDGGTTFLTDGTVTTQPNGSVKVDLPKSGTAVTFAQDSNIHVNSLTDKTDSKGAWLWLRPSAQYNGDDMDQGKTVVTGVGSGTNQLTASCVGAFTTNAVVRIDNTTPVTMKDKINYSFSMDNGLTWVTGNTIAPDASSNATMLNLTGGGVLHLSSNGSNILNPGAQFFIKPNTAAVELRVNVSESVRINDVGKDIFGGIYQDSTKASATGGSRLLLSSSNASAVFDRTSTDFFASNGGTATKNMFETMGNLIAFMETNNQHGISQCLESLKLTQSQVLTATASVGGRENRLTITSTVLDNLKANENEQLSSQEDVDLSTLMTQLSLQQTAYQAVLKSSSMIMQMNLMQYL
jgi:flagellar hook-associated protein 3 FlgL